MAVNYTKSPTETVEQYNTRIATERGDSSQSLAQQQVLSSAAAANPGATPQQLLGFVGSTQSPPTHNADVLSSSAMALPSTGSPQFDTYFNSIIDQDFQSQEAQRLEQERIAKQNQLDSLSKQLEGKGAALASKESELGVPAYVQELQDLRLKIPDKIKALEEGILAEQGLGRPLGLTTGRQDALRRQGMIEVNYLQAREAALRGNVELAQQLADRAIEAQFQPIEQQIANVRQYLEVNAERMTLQQKKDAAKLSLVLDERERLITTQKERQQQVFALASKYIDAGISPLTDSYESAVQKVINNSQEYKTERARAAELARTDQPESYNLYPEYNDTIDNAIRAGGSSVEEVLNEVVSVAAEDGKTLTDSQRKAIAKKIKERLANPPLSEEDISNPATQAEASLQGTAFGDSLIGFGAAIQGGVESVGSAVGGFFNRLFGR